MISCLFVCWRGWFLSIGDDMVISCNMDVGGRYDSFVEVFEIFVFLGNVISRCWNRFGDVGI